VGQSNISNRLLGNGCSKRVLKNHPLFQCWQGLMMLLRNSDFAHIRQVRNNFAFLVLKERTTRLSPTHFLLNFPLFVRIFSPLLGPLPPSATMQGQGTRARHPYTFYAPARFRR